MRLPSARQGCRDRCTTCAPRLFLYKRHKVFFSKDTNALPILNHSLDLLVLATLARAVDPT